MSVASLQSNTWIDSLKVCLSQRAHAPLELIHTDPCGPFRHSQVVEAIIFLHSLMITVEKHGYICFIMSLKILASSRNLKTKGHQLKVLRSYG